MFQSLEKLNHLVSIVSWPWRFVTSSLHVHSKHCEDTLQTVQFISWEGNSDWLANVLEFSVDWATIPSSPTATIPSPPPPPPPPTHTHTFSKDMKSVVSLSICKWIGEFDCRLVNVKIANYAAINSRTIMYKLIFLFGPFSPSWHPAAKSCPTWFWCICLGIFYKADPDPDTELQKKRTPEL